MTDLATMTNAEIVTSYETNSARQSEISNKLIEDGFGWVKVSDMRSKPELHPIIPEYLRLLDVATALGIEANLRYGPGFIDIPHLVAAQGGRYRRKPKG